MVLPFLASALGQTLIQAGISAGGGLWGMFREKKARRREAAAITSDLLRQRDEELERYREDVGSLYGSAETNLAAGGVKSTYLPNLRTQRLTRGTGNIMRGYGAMLNQTRNMLR